MPQLMHPDLARILAREDIEQLTPKWFEWRGRMVTASQVASITGECPYKSAVQLLKEKVGETHQQMSWDVPLQSFFFPCRCGLNYDKTRTPLPLAGDNLRKMMPSSSTKR